MARKRTGRDYAAEYKRRQAKARKEGYAGYYGKRVRRGAPASAPAPKGESLRRARGHASRADLARLLRSGQVEILDQTPVGPREQGRFQRVEITAQLANGDQRKFTLRKAEMTTKKLKPLREAITESESDIYSLYDYLGLGTKPLARAA